MRAIWRALLVAFVASGCGASSRLPAMPLNVSGVRSPDRVALSWDPVLGAQSYRVYFTVPVGKGRVQSTHFDVRGSVTSASVDQISRYGVVQMAVSAVSSSGTGPPSAFLTFPDSTPILTATEQTAGVQLQWSLLTLNGVVTLLRGPPGAVPQPISVAPAGNSLLDADAQVDTTYSYFVSVQMGKVAAVSNEVRVRTVPGVPGVIAYSNRNGVELDVTAVPDAAMYEVGASAAPGGPYTWSLQNPPTDGTAVFPLVMACPPGGTCYFVVRAIDANQARGVQSGEVQGRHGPSEPDAPSVEIRVGAVHLSWNQPPEAASYRLYRASSQTDLPTLLATVSQPFFDDTSAMPFQPYYYSVQAVSVDGHGLSSLSRQSFGLCTTAPDQVSAGAPIASSNGRPTRQTFTVGQSGQLMGIELAPATASFDVSVAIRKGPFTVATGGSLWRPSAPPVSLAADRVQGTYYDLSSAGLLVSAGEQLTVELPLNGDWLLSGAGYASGSFAPMGYPDTTHALLFKTFVEARSPAAPVLQALGGDRSLSLSWTGVPGATGYHLFERAADGTLTAVAQTASSFLIVNGLAPGSVHSYVVRSDGVVAQSQPATASVLSLIVDQQNSGMVQGAALATINLAQASLTQSFTAGASGSLAGIELGADATNMITPWTKFELLDSSGRSLGQGTLVAPAPAISSGPFPLSSPLRTGAFIDFSALGSVVAPGMILSVRLTGTVGTSYLDTPDVYPGGAEGGGSPARDLVFRSWIAP